ncbi:hypothetical protein [Streptomyces meridianus]|uniref:DUF4449 domain-containing protein n=1 Tax=Streptomyces meridianus TaxID=2938945 RepID=A0ABT0XDZ3_9ACTN|nr:hypothetical protein [Streptomyces meridianus]MCM2580545.1 hypothetical protein [Streptomyces meridianus]
MKRRRRAGPGRALLGPLLAVIAAILLALAASAPGARAADGLSDAAQSLRQGPVYVDPRAQDLLPPRDADALADKIKKADKPVFVAVLPQASEFKPATLLQDLRTQVGITGVYGVQLGDGFDAGADSQVMSRNAVANLTGSVERANGGDTKALLNDFVDGATADANGQAPSSWSGVPDNPGPSGIGKAITLGVVLVLLPSALLLLYARGRKRRVDLDRARLETLRPVVDEDITTFGEELDRIGFRPASPEADDAMREDYGRALDSYERAKSSMAAARRSADVQPVTRALEDGRFALATVEARRAGRPLPERRPPCFFDPGHGPSVKDVTWAPEGGTERSVPVCGADATRLESGEEPLARTVETPGGRRPYWDAGPAYAPWAAGYFGGGLLPGLMFGTLLGHVISSPAAYAGSDFGGGYDGGDASGADFDAGDFGGGGFDGGGFGGFDGGGGF